MRSPLSADPSFAIGSRKIGDGSPCFIIGEIAQAHDGSLGQAHAFIDALAKTGVDAVKFQTHLAAHESTLQEPWRVSGKWQDESRYAYWKRMEFTQEEWRELKQHAQQQKLVFLSSPFSIEAVELLEGIGISAWKVGSGEVSNPLLCDRLASTGLPILLSTGMSPWEEIDKAVARFRVRQSPLAVLQCTSLYPCPREKIGLNLLTELRQRYQCPVGLSDHSGSIYPGLAAAALGIDVLEVHVTLSREMYGPDVSSSLTTAELRQLLEGVRFIEAMRKHPVDKDAMARELHPLRDLFTKSVVAKTPLPAGLILQEEHLTLKKPGTGIPASRLHEVLGKRLRRTLQPDELLQEADLG